MWKRKTNLEKRMAQDLNIKTDYDLLKLLIDQQTDKAIKVHTTNGTILEIIPAPKPVDNSNEDIFSRYKI